MRTLTAIVICGALCAGCGGSHSRSTAGSSTATGAGVFSQDCQSCHSLVGTESEHRPGGDLLGYRMSRAQLLAFARIMPTRRRLTPAQLSAVADYVLRAQARAARGRG